MPRERVERDPDLERLLLLTDGVFAIAMTLLAVELGLPEEARHSSGLGLMAYLLSTWPQVFAFVQSFTILALYWSAHHRTYRHLRRSDGAFVWLNLAFLLTVSFQPFPTSVVGEHLFDPASGMFYFGSLVLTSASFWAMWWYATTQHRLVDPKLASRLVRHYRRVLGVPAVVFVLGTLLAAMTLIVPALKPLFALFVAVAYLVAVSYIVLAVREIWEPR